MTDRSSFNLDNDKKGSFNPAVKLKSPTANQFDSNALNNIIKEKIVTKEEILNKTTEELLGVKDKEKKQRGRPIVITDERFKVNKPKTISAALNAKLDTLQDYVTEFQEINGRITFEKYIDTLIDAYVVSKLSYSKQERFKEEYQEALDKLKK